MKIIASSAPIFMELKFFSDILRLFYAEFNLNFPTNKERMVAVYIDLCVRYDCLSGDFHEADQAPNRKYSVPMSLWLVEKNHRVKISGVAENNK